MLQTLRDYDLDLTALKDNEKIRKNPNKYSIMDKLLLAEQIESRLRLLNNQQQLNTTQPQDKPGGGNESNVNSRANSSANVMGSLAARDPTTTGSELRLNRSTNSQSVL